MGQGRFQGPRYTYTSLRKFMRKCKEQLGTPYIVHADDLREDEGIVFVPLYMVPLL